MSHHPNENPSNATACLQDEPSTFFEQVAAFGGKATRLNLGTRCYNPGIAEARFPTTKGEKYLVTFRDQDPQLPDFVSASKIGIAGLDKDFKVLWSRPVLGLPTLNRQGMLSQEDGRLIWFYGKLYLAYSNACHDNNRVDWTVKQSLVEICVDETKAYMVSHKSLNFGKNSLVSPAAEKNWGFFDDVSLKFVYTIYPHVVVDAVTHRAHVTRCEPAAWWTKSWGEMHGGTPPIELPHNGGFLSFFNSYLPHSRRERRYVIGAYVFGTEEQKYRIKGITASPLFYGSERDGFLWNSPVYWEPVVNFAVGALLEGDEVILTSGVNDCYGYISRLPLAKVMAQMHRAY